MLVTGGAGFVGAALCRVLVERGARVTALDDLSSGDEARLALRDRARFAFVRGDVRSSAVLASILARERFDAVVHLAAVVGVRRVLADPRGARASNLAGVRALIESLGALDERDRPRVLFASTSEVYAEKEGPIAEHDALRAHADDGRWAYASSKREGEELLDACGLWPRERAPLHLRLFNVAGPGQSADQGMAVARFVAATLAGEPLVVHGDGRQVRTFAHVDDVAEIVARLVERDPLAAGALNVGGRARTDLGSLARRVVELARSRSPIVHVDPRVELGRAFEDVRVREPDLARLERIVGPVPSRALDAIVTDALESARAPVAHEDPACASLAS